MSAPVQPCVHTFPLWLEVTWLVAGSLSLSNSADRIIWTDFLLGPINLSVLMLVI